MSFLEMKKEIPTLTRDERLELAHMLHLCDLQDDPAYAAEMNRRMKEMDEGKKVTLEQFERMHRELLAQGK